MNMDDDAPAAQAGTSHDVDSCWGLRVMEMKGNP